MLWLGINSSSGVHGLAWLLVNRFVSHAWLLNSLMPTSGAVTITFYYQNKLSIVITAYFRKFADWTILMLPPHKLIINSAVLQKH